MDENMYYDGSTVCNAGENVELQWQTVMKQIRIGICFHILRF